MRASILVLVAALAVTFVPFPLANASSFTVTATNFAWTPSSLSVVTGDTVTFTNGGGSHNWVSDSGMGSCGLPCTKTFNTAGTFNYHCGVHPSTMRGSVSVGALPTIAISSPANNAVVSGTIAVSGTASHPTSNIANVKVKVDSGAASTATLTPAVGTSVSWSYNLNTIPIADGLHTITATVTTASGLTKAATVTVNVDNLQVAIVTPSAGATVAGTLAVSGTASHTTYSIVSVLLSVDGATGASATLTPNGGGVDWSFSLDTLPLTNAAHTLTAIATTSGATTESTTISVIVANPVTRDLIAGTLSATTPLTGNPVITVGVTNPGNTASGTYQVRFEYLKGSTWTSIGVVNAPTLAAHGSSSVSITWASGIHLGRYNVRATLDSGSAVAETDEANNIATGTATWYTSLVAGQDPLG